MNKIFDGKRYWLLDGAMGTMLQKSGLKLGKGRICFPSHILM